ncbi:MAG: bifunctional diaminohydroxyphosphoribosylaminopyrimidine deaminase/5-amino-6-(5-phosphoribosylamino)uracil reductase RibD [Gammaproteobacteria bacterium]
MARALQLARFGLNTCHPNPRVGCVLVKEGERVGEGWHRYAGGPHAEIIALSMAGPRAAGATCYVSLEPCCHHGRTPPCTEALVKAGVRRVVAAAEDPSPRVRGQGFAILQEAGMQVECGLLEGESRHLNRGFFSRMERGRPFVTCKLAGSLDGRTASASGESKWITAEPARADVQRLRAQASAVMTGIATVLSDDPSLTVRDPEIEMGGRQPLRVIMDSSLRTPLNARLHAQPGKTCIMTLEQPQHKQQPFIDRGVTVLMVSARDGRVDLSQALERLSDMEINEVLLEAGPTLAGAMFRAGLVDEIVLYTAPMLLGGEAQPLLWLPGISRLSDGLRLQVKDLRQIGADLRITAGVSTS